jgi:4'-phosphopantetheinyl transferase
MAFRPVVPDFEQGLNGMAHTIWPEIAPGSCRPGSIVVWRIMVDRFGAETQDALLAALSPSERERASRFRRDSDQRLYVTAHGVLRHLVGRAVGRTPVEVAFGIGDHGKPYCTDGGVNFNISHSGGIALIALSDSCSVGVDVECIRAVTDHLAIARRFFHPAEVADISGLPGESSRHAFFRCWSRKEAVVKASGEGLSLPLNSFRVTCLADDDAAIVSPVGDVRWTGWTLANLDIAPGYCAALAARAESIDVETRTFSPSFLNCPA